MSSNTIYTHGHHESVLRSHSWRTAQNSAPHLLPYIKPHMHILDIGCGPGTITLDFAQLVPEGHITGIEPSPGAVLSQARQIAQERGISNVEFKEGDIFELREMFGTGKFDIVHVHQVLQHIDRERVAEALMQMRAVTKPGGIIAAREVDFAAMTWFPVSEGMKEWGDTYQLVARANGGEPDAGRRLVSWALKAGFARDEIMTSAGTWCFSTPEEREWWSKLWADRTLSSNFKTTALKSGLADEEKLNRIAASWMEWGKSEDGWFAILNGEIICRVD
ncbi:UbiE/COQ5 family methyltransferase [Suillus paluster]|uniref:UbiE/COQ5 family methyltransferase n=1 Tax=Suillus paluster TaxID=48578 RepID=UPI001B881670|nr:UbiE/COQ5 family methyltransferase [Suillus paluster]KAG1733218.1 UbiE/COQ5 family methyltransferase [Suillus paluster]